MTLLCQKISSMNFYPKLISSPLPILAPSLSPFPSLRLSCTSYVGEEMADLMAMPSGKLDKHSSTEIILSPGSYHFPYNGERSGFS